MSDVSAIGIMDPAFMVGKATLLRWINDFFKLNYTKVEQCASGALHCQILDACFPGQVPLQKVNFDAKFDYEFVQNFKVFQDVFTKQGITKHVPVEKLIKAKFQDNLEFLQWMKHFFDAKYNGAPYDAVARRAVAKGGKAPAGAKAPAPAAAAKPAPAAAKPAAKPAAAPAGKIAKPAAVAKAPVRAAGRAASPTPAARASSPTPADKKKPAAKPGIKPASAAPKASADPGSESKDNQVQALQEEIARLTTAIEGCQKESNFYFEKLRRVEILCQSDEDVESALKQEILKILYETDGNDEFQAPDVEQQAMQVDRPDSALGAGADQVSPGEELVSDSDLMSEAVTF
jgi:RP/EB family microtubule-associated protein